jgi:tetratricopeptide (TPR) repeat protein
VKRARQADSLHQAGRIAEAADLFREVEQMQKQQEGEFPFLYSLSGFQYCDLLLGQGLVQQVKERASRTLEVAKREFGLLSNALDNLSLGRAWLMEAEQANAGYAAQATKFLLRAVDGFRQAGTQHHLPRGLLARAALYRVTSDYAHAQRDLDEMFRIANRSGMGLHLVDYQLESARLHLARGNRDKAREHLATAKEMIERMGYHRRDPEVEELARQCSPT